MTHRSLVISEIRLLSLVAVSKVWRLQFLPSSSCEGLVGVLVAQHRIELSREEDLVVAGRAVAAHKEGRSLKKGNRLKSST